MWKLLTGISLTVCSFAVAAESPTKSSISANCCGRLRHGVMAIGCETTGTTITFNRIVWELQLNDDTAREFARKHHREAVVVTGELRKVVATESKVRWIIDVKSLSELEPGKNTEGANLTIRGKLEAARSNTDDAAEILIDVDDQIWPIDASSDSRLQVNAESLIGEPIVATCRVERTPDEDSPSPIIIRVNSLRRTTDE